LAALLTLPVLALAPTACGGSSSSSSGNGEASKPPEQILTDAVTAAKGASSVRVSGSIVDSGQPIALDLKLVNGKGGTGSMTIQGAPVSIIDVNHTLYMNGSDAFWSKVGGGSAVVKLLHGRWLKTPASANFASLATLTSMQTLFSQLLTSHGALKKGATGTVSGQSAVPVTDSAKGGTIYVAASGKPYPIQLSKAGSGGGTVRFTEYGKAVALAAPANAIDISHLKG
jgi:hypothetical protein